MGTVYRAEDVATGRRVALKLATTPHLADALARERAALSVVANRHVVGYVGEGTTHDGSRFVVVEWLDGEDLRTVLARGALAIDVAVRIATELCVGLAAVHASGFVHRDVTPSNVMIAPDGRATLLDFGLAARTGAERASRFGTAAYLAPELIGRRAHVDPRADVYAVGCTLFECLTGAPPFGSGGDASTLLRAILEPAPRVRTRRPEIPAWLGELVAMLLHKSPEDRPDAGGVVLQLRDHGRIAAGAPDTERGHAHAFALVRLGSATSDATVDLDDASPAAVAAICRGFGIRVDAPLDVLVLTARDPDPRDQLRRLLGACSRISANDIGAAIAVISAGQGAIERGRHLLATVPRNAMYLDDETRRLAPAGAAGFAKVVGGGFLVAAAPHVTEPATAIVGRDEVVARIGGELTRRSPAPGFAIVLGDAGVGKTAVLQAVRAARGSLAHGPVEGQLHLADAPYHALREWLCAWLARAGAIDEATLRSELVRLLGRRGVMRVPELARLVGVAAPGVGHGSASRDSLEAAIVDAVGAALEGEPLVIDDAQWLDPASASVLLRLARRRTRPAIVLAARRELCSAFPELVAQASLVEDLAALAPAASAALVARIAPQLDPATVAALARDAEGHPLILLELARAAACGTADRAPASAIGLVQARLLRLSPDARHAVAVASVLGGRIVRTALLRYLEARVAAGSERDAAVDELCRTGIFVPDPGDPTALRFATALVGEAAYALLVEPERIALHGAIARDLGDDSATEPAVLRRHAEGANATELVTLAHVLAAERAALLFDFDAACDAVRDGIASGASAELLGRLRSCEAEALLMAERYAEADLRAREAAEFLRRGSLRWMHAYSIRTRAAFRRLETSGALAIFGELAATATDASAASLAVQIMAGIAGNLILVGLVAEGERCGATVETIAAAHSATPEVEAELCRLRGRRAQARGEWDRYRVEFERAAELREGHGHVVDAVLARLNVAHAWFELGAGVRAIDIARSAVEEATELELPYVLGYGRFLLGFFLRSAGNLDAARAELHRALEDADEDPRRAGEIEVELAFDAIDRGAHAEARHHAERALVLLAPAPTHVPQSCAARAAVELRAGDPVAALAWAERAHTAAAPLGLMVEDLSMVRAVFLEACLACGDARATDLARAAVAELDERERRLASPELAAGFRARIDNARLRELATALIAPRGT
jgi:tetratricopeptide (TPR) repeat protein